MRNPAVMTLNHSPTIPSCSTALSPARRADIRSRTAGLPIIDTYQKLVETGDRVLRIEGAVSGTLMYVVSAVSAGRPFSEAVREAVDKGYAEPDPRDDLNGADAARKVLILARLMGYRGAAPVPEDLVPPALAKLPLAEFMKP